MKGRGCNICKYGPNFCAMYKPSDYFDSAGNVTFTYSPCLRQIIPSALEKATRKVRDASL